MNVKESCQVECNAVSALDLTVDNVVQVFLNHEEEVQNFTKKKQSLEIEFQNRKTYMHQLELEKSEIDDNITKLKLRNAAYQREHTNLRNAITVVKFQIEKIKESIERAKEKEMEDIDRFEKSIDEITEKFRSGRDIYDRRRILEKIEEERKRKNDLVRKREELRNSYLQFLAEKGLRGRKNENEELIDCVLPGSELFELIEMTKNLDEVMYGESTN